MEKRFGCTKESAKEVITSLKKLIAGNIEYPSIGICGNVARALYPDLGRLKTVKGNKIDFALIFKALEKDDIVYPIGGMVEFDENDFKWIEEMKEKRVALCKEVVELLKKTFKI